MRLASAFAALALVSCGADFDPASKVTGPRVLGVVASLPEATFDDDVTLEAVLGSPMGSLAGAALAWSVCPVSLGALAGYACADPSLELPIPTADAAGPTATLRGAAFAAGLQALRPHFPQLLEGLRRTVSRESDPCEWEMIVAYDACDLAQEACLDAAYQATVACLRSGGLDVTARLIVTPSSPGALPFEAVKRVLFRDPSPDRPPNHNPRLTGLKAFANVDAEGPALAVPPGATLTVPAGWVISLVPILAEGSVEALPPDDPDRLRPGATGAETVFFSWYGTGGRFAYDRTTVDVPDTPWDAPPADDLPAGPLQAWVFARDSRLGADYLTFFLRVVPTADGLAVEVAP